MEPFPFLTGSVGCRNGDPSPFDDDVWDLLETKLLLSSVFCKKSFFNGGWTFFTGIHKLIRDDVFKGVSS